MLCRKFASRTIKCPWEPLSDRKEKYARVQVSHSSNKRQVGKLSRKNSSCVVHASIWSALQHSSGAKSKAFRRESLSHCVIPSWDSATLLAVNDAFDSSIFVSFTWVLVGLSTKRGSHGLALLQFTKEGIRLDAVFDLEDAPVQGIVLRGPHILCSTSAEVILIAKDGTFSMDYLPSDCMNPSAVERCLCVGERDREGLLITIDRDAPKSEVLKMYLVDAMKQACEELWSAEYAGKNIAAAAVSLRRGIVVLCESDGSMKAIDVKSGNPLWEGLGGKDMGTPSDLAFCQNGLLISELDSEALWGVSLVETSFGNTHRAKLLFPEKCSALGSQNHNHFFAPWRGSLLQCNNENGTHCADKDMSAVQITSKCNLLQGTPFMHAVTKNLEHRLDVGVQRVTEAAQKREDKSDMLVHVRSLLRNAESFSPRIIQHSLFRGSLENIVENPERRRSIGNGSEAQLDSDVPMGCSIIVVNGRSQCEDRPRLVRLLSSVAGVDKTERFIVIRVHISVLGPETSGNEKLVPGIGIQLNMQFSKSYTIWDVQKKTGLRPGAMVWLHACAPISAIISDNTSNVVNLSVSVRVNADDGRSQLLGTFNLANVLSCSLQMEAVASRGDGCNLIDFEKYIYAIAQGASAHQLQRLVHLRSVAEGFTVTALENLACLAFKVRSKVELAMAIAKLRACLPDEVRLQSSPAPSQGAVRLVDASVRALEQEMTLVRSASLRRDEVGYEASRMLEILRCQMVVDDYFGQVEEQFLGS